MLSISSSVRHSSPQKSSFTSHSHSAGQRRVTQWSAWFKATSARLYDQALSPLRFAFYSKSRKTTPISQGTRINNPAWQPRNFLEHISVASCYSSLAFPSIFRSAHQLHASLSEMSLVMRHMVISSVFFLIAGTYICNMLKNLRRRDNEK